MQQKNKNKKSVLPALLVLVLALIGVLFFPNSEKESAGDTSSAYVQTQSVSEVSSEESEEPEQPVSASNTENPDTFSDLYEAETSAEAQPAAEPEPAAQTGEYHFRNSNLLNQHYEKHGIEMGFASAEEYEAAASRVVSDPQALHKTEAEDGDDIYYIEATNEFVIVSTDGYLRTYFLPSAGLAYYNRQ